MGYMGLDGWCDSDEAADLRSDMLTAAARVLEKNVNKKTNQYNTDGDINVALILEDDAIFGNMEDSEREYFRKAALMAIKSLEQKIEDAGDYDKTNDNVHMHITAFKRMVKNLKKFLEGTGESE